MSAGNSPPNPGAPRSNPRAPRPPVVSRSPGRLAAALALGGVMFYVYNRPPAPRDHPVWNTRTQGVANVEKAYTNAGATPTHTPAYGGTHQGDKNAVDFRDNHPAGSGGPKHKESPFQDDHMGDDQRPGSKSKIGEVLDHTNYGDSRGK